MNYLKKSGVFILLTCLSSFSFAEDVILNEHTIESKALGEEQKITVYLPNDYDEKSGHQYPVLYLLDGKYYKRMVQGVVTSYYSNALIPDILVVAIENEDRIRDYTPSPHETHKGAGGADVFLDYIEKELIPFIDTTYQTSDFRILNGHSLGGLLSLHALHSRPELFTAHFALSPSLHWGNKETVKKLMSYVSSKKKLNQFVYMNLGNEGFNSGTDQSKLMRKAFLELQELLQETTPSGFRVKSELLQTLPHVATNITGLTHALNELYRNWSLPFAVMEQGREGIIKHFQSLSDDLYYEIKPRKGAVNFGGDYMTHGLFKPDQGMDLFKYNAELYPDSAWVQFNLAKAYKNREQNECAKQQAELALKYIGDDEEDLKASIIEFLQSYEGEKFKEEKG